MFCWQYSYRDSDKIKTVFLLILRKIAEELGYNLFIIENHASPEMSGWAIYKCPSCEAGGRQDTTWAAQSGDIHFRR